MQRELEIAADWWATQIAGLTKQDNAASHTDTPSAEQIDAFKRHFINSVGHTIRNRDCWVLDDPNYGMTTEGRCLHVDYHPDRLLREAAKSAGINDVRFPIKTTMWISPGRVRVAHGYGAEPIDLPFDPPKMAEEE